MPMDDLDMQVRLAAFEYLKDLTMIHGDVLPAAVLRRGFEFKGRQVRLKGIQGIFKPEILPEIPLSITTAAVEPNREAPYHDHFSADGSTLFYSYRGNDPNHHENARMRLARKQRRPLIYFHGVVKHAYFAHCPVYVVGDEPARLRFLIALDDATYLSGSTDPVAASNEEVRRAYITVIARRRLHQCAFRARVLRAYRERCALCRLRHSQLLDAAHILPDTDPHGEPFVSNGLALCKLHHAAFDQDLIAVRPDLVVEVHPKILNEKDGPMLMHGLQGFHGRRIDVPLHAEHRPRPDYLEERYHRFLVKAFG